VQFSVNLRRIFCPVKLHTDSESLWHVPGNLREAQKLSIRQLAYIPCRPGGAKTPTREFQSYCRVGRKCYLRMEPVIDFDFGVEHSFVVYRISYADQSENYRDRDDRRTQDLFGPAGRHL
jgi:hypothetical protein